ncbi:cytochrome P450 [Zhongshania arctica]|uniref:Cytochrome P450 n=1 Tax=Zhongshania arctica TaxID=3238302 RepID=A0ABV3TV87_9GAMM
MSSVSASSNNSNQAKLDLPAPSVSGLRLGLEYWFRPEVFMSRLESLGDRFLMPLPGFPTSVGLTSPEDVRKIFAGDQTALHFGEALGKVSPHPVLLGENSISFKDDEPHLEDRKLMLPHFSRGAAKKYEYIFAKKTEEHMARWPRGKSFSFHQAMMDLTLDIIVDVVMGVTQPTRARRLRRAVLDMVSEVGSIGFLFSTIVAVSKGGRWDGKYKKLRAAIADGDNILLEEMNERRASGDEQREDVLAVFLQMQSDNPEKVTDEYIFEALRTMLIAGYETTASTLGWLGERISRNPRVVTEIERSIEDDDYTYVEAVCSEALRSRPVLPFTGRLVVKPVDLGAGLVLEPGMLVFTMMTLLHHREDVYPNAEEFRPERFLEKKVSPYEMITFGGGLRRCLGAPFAVSEMHVIITTICRNLHFETTNKPSERIARRSITLVPSKGAQVVLSER